MLIKIVQIKRDFVFIRIFKIINTFEIEKLARSKHIRITSGRIIAGFTEISVKGTAEIIVTDKISMVVIAHFFSAGSGANGKTVGGGSFRYNIYYTTQSIGTIKYTGIATYNFDAFDIMYV